MSITSGRILKASDGICLEVVPLSNASSKPRGRGQWLHKVEVAAHERAKKIVENARQQAEQLRLEALAAAAHDRLELELRARAEALVAVIGPAIAWHHRARNSAVDSTERTVDIARLLAERLLGQSLQLAPESIASIARQVVREATGARRAILYAHPLDAEYLTASWAAEITLLDSLAVQNDPTLARGHLRLETELGHITTDLGSQLERLAEQTKRLLGS